MPEVTRADMIEALRHCSRRADSDAADWAAGAHAGSTRARAASRHADALRAALRKLEGSEDGLREDIANARHD